MTGRYGGGRKAAAPSFSGNDDKDNDTWKPKHTDVVRRISKSPASTSISVRGMLPDEWSLVHVSLSYDTIGNKMVWTLKPLQANGSDKPENS